MATTKTRRGRKEKPFQLADGNYVNGLRRRANDGRWVVIATGQMFTEPDEAKAIAKFHRLLEQSDGAKELGARQERNRRHNFIGVDWQQVRRDFLIRPKYVAEQTGLPTLEWYRSFQAPEELPSLDAIKKNWATHKRCGKEQKSKVLRYWQDFVDFTMLKSIDEITARMAIDYQDYTFAW